VVALNIVNQSQKRRQHPLASPRAQLKVLDALALTNTFDGAVADTPLGELRATGVDILQINVGKQCNQTCKHCHVDAGPDRDEVMPDDVVDACLALLERSDIATLDITGGAPELHPRFEEIVKTAASLGKTVMDRCNLTILRVPKYQHLPAFFAEHGVEVVCSLPYHSQTSTDAQRGDGVYDKSIEALQALNALGYGREGSGLKLTLVTNPVGAFLPAPQAAMEADFRRRLQQKHNVVFNQLFSITNMPISRYLEWLEDSGNLEVYMGKLVSSFNAGAVEGVMCRNTVSVGWEGALYDCDFNQMLELPVTDDVPRTIHDWVAALEQLDHAGLATRRVVTRAHCFGCTAGQGSSCGGATA
jgi:radical SAM/Cys-rich protein